jgi:hypothetical protein
MYQKLYAAHIFVSFSPPPSEVRAGYRKKTRKVSAEDESSCVRVRSKIYLRATVQDGVSGLNKQLQDFFASYAQYGRSPLFQDGVSGVHKMAR